MEQSEVLKMSQEQFENLVESTGLTPEAFKAKLEEGLLAIRKARKLYRKEVMHEVFKYHTTMGYFNLQVAESELLIARLQDTYPELNKSFGTKFKEFVKDLPAAAAGVTQKH